MGEDRLRGAVNRRPVRLQGIERALQYARTLHCPRIHVMAGLKPVTANTLACWQKNLQKATALAAQVGDLVGIEVIPTSSIALDVALGIGDDAALLTPPP